MEHNPITTVEKEKILILLNNGYTIKQTAEAIGKSQASVSYFIYNKLGSVPPRYKELKGETLKIAVKMRQENCSLSQISEATGISKERLSNKFKSLNMPRIHAPKFWSDKKVRELEDYILADLSYNEICEKIGRNIKYYLKYNFGSYNLLKVKKILQEERAAE